MLRRRAGQRRHWVELQSITGRTASGDGYLDTWTTYARSWASVEPATASAVERLTANTQQVPVTHVVTLDYRSDLLAKHRVRVGGTRALYIRGIQNDEERNRTFTLSCEERAS
jgi:SPP1 family predicted phage head-tail adaptor